MSNTDPLPKLAEFVIKAMEDKNVTNTQIMDDLKAAFPNLKRSSIVSMVRKGHTSIADDKIIVWARSLGVDPFDLYMAKVEDASSDMKRVILGKTVNDSQEQSLLSRVRTKLSNISPNQGLTEDMIQRMVDAI